MNVNCVCCMTISQIVEKSTGIQKTSHCSLLLTSLSIIKTTASGFYEGLDGRR